MQTPCVVRRGRFRLRSVCTVMIILYILAPAVRGQLPSGTDRTAGEKSFALEIEVLTQPQPSYRINAQKWGRVFQELGYVVRFRDGRPGERSRVEDVDRRGTKTSLVVGIMDGGGLISLRGQNYQMTQPQPLVDFLERIRAYGAAGPPSEDPRWGLTEEQFAAVSRLLSAPVNDPVVLKTPMDAIESLQLPAVFRVRFTDAARKIAFTVISDPAVIGQDLTGISKGTALAVSLAQFGLGFRPMANSDAGGSYIIEVEAGGESNNLWPVGWKSTQPLGTVLPSLYKSIPVEVEDVEVDAFIEVIAGRLEIPSFQSSFFLNAADRNPARLTYSRKADRLSPSRLLTLLGDRFQLGLDVRCDEAGRCFLWTTTREEFLAFRQRFAHVVPGK